MLCFFRGRLRCTRGDRTSPYGMDFPKAKAAPAASDGADGGKESLEGLSFAQAEKKLKANMKKLRQVEELKEKGADNLDPDQLKKLEGEVELREQIAELEKIVG